MLVTVSRIAKTSAVRVYSMLIGLLIMALSARWLGPEGLGQIATITNWVAAFCTFGHLSLGQVGVREAALDSSGPWLQTALPVLLIFALATSALAWVLVSILHWLSNGDVFRHVPTGLLLIGFAALPFMIWEQYGSHLLMALQRLDIYNRYMLIGRTSAIVLLPLLLVGLQWGVVGALLVTLIAQAVVAGGGIRFLVQGAGGLTLPRMAALKKYVRSGVALHINAVGTFMLSGTTIIILSHQRGLHETGYFQLGMYVLSAMMIIPQSAAMVMYGHAAALGADAAWMQQRRVLVVVTLLMVLVAVALGVLAPQLLPLIAGESFRESVGVFRWQLLSIIGMTMGNIMAPQWIARGLFWQISAIAIANGLITLGASLILIPEYGMYGAAWATAIAYLVATAVNLGMVVYCEKRILGVAHGELRGSGER